MLPVTQPSVDCVCVCVCVCVSIIFTGGFPSFFVGFLFVCLLISLVFSF